MTDSLSAALLTDDVRPRVVTALLGVVDEEVKAKKGISGGVLKAAYAAAKKVQPGILPRALDSMLPDFARSLDPFWADFRASGGGDFGAFLVGRGDAAADALLSVTDARAERTSREPLKKAYRGVRGKAKEHVKAALPRLGSTLQSFAG